MLPITAHPAIMKKYGTHFQTLFTKPSYEHFLNYVTGLITVEHPTIAGIAAHIYQGKDQSSLNRFFTKTDWDVSNLNEERLALLQQNQKTAWKQKGVICIDDTFSQKSGQSMEGAGWYKDHAGNKGYVFAHNFIYSHYADNQVQYPLDFHLYVKENDIEDQDLLRAFQDKIQLAQKLVDQAERRKTAAQTYVFDSWYFCRELTDHIETYQKDWISVSKLNRIVLWNGNKVILKDFVMQTIPWESYKRLEVNGKIFWYFSKSVTLKSQGKVRIVATFEERDNERTKEPTVLVTNRKDWNAKKIIETYAMRWSIETFFRDGKQSLGFEDYQLRSIKAVERHLCLVNVAYSLLELERIESRLLTKVHNQLQTIGKTAKNVANDLLRSLVLWVYEQTKKTKNPELAYQMLLT